MDIENFKKLIKVGRKVLYRTYEDEEREGKIRKITEFPGGSVFYSIDNYLFPLEINRLIGVNL